MTWIADYYKKIYLYFRLRSKNCLVVTYNYGRKLAAIIASGEISSLKGGHV